jgi:hypothetical protein
MSLSLHIPIVHVPVTIVDLRTLGEESYEALCRESQPLHG